MFALFGLIFLAIKIALLATVYTLITFIILYVLSKFSPIEWIQNLMRHKLLTFFVTGLIYSVLLFCYAFSYWGYSGLGDYFCIPAGNGVVVSSIDDQESSYIQTGHRQAFIKNFKISDDKVCAEFSGFNSDDCEDCFIVFDTGTEEYQEFHSTEEYTAYAKEQGLPLKEEFKNFNDNYRNHWSGKRNWFLP